jgi:hypothetical protein
MFDTKVSREWKLTNALRLVLRVNRAAILARSGVASRSSEVCPGAVALDLSVRQKGCSVLADGTQGSMLALAVKRDARQVVGGLEGSPRTIAFKRLLRVASTHHRAWVAAVGITDARGDRAHEGRSADTERAVGSRSSSLSAGRASTERPSKCRLRTVAAGRLLWNTGVVLPRS